MLAALLNSVLPVFAVLGLGLAFAWRGVFGLEHAQAINRFVFYLGVPVLNFHLLVKLDPSAFDWQMLGLYFCVELAFYAGGFALFYLVFKRGVRQSLVLGLSMIFCNHVFYVLPISVGAFGPWIELPIVAMINVDVIVFFFGTVIALEIAAAFEDPQQLEPVATRIMKRLAGNPLIWSVFAAVLFLVFDVNIDNGMGRFLEFAGAAAAPTSLFALGVILVKNREPVSFKLVGLILLSNLLVLPVVMYLVASGLMQADLSRVAPLVMVAAGPVGAMPFVLAVQHNQNTGEIGQAILISMVLSLLSLSALIGAFSVLAV